MPTNSKQLTNLIDKLDRLPPEYISEVEDFVDLLASKAQGKAFSEFLATADQIAKAGIPVMSQEEIEAEIKAYRNGRAAGS